LFRLSVRDAGAYADAHMLCPLPTATVVALAFLLIAAPVQAADVKAAKKGTTLVLVGDADPNSIHLSEAGDIITVTPTVGTLNGGGAPEPFAGIKSISIKLAGGQDAASLTNVALSGSLLIDGGVGDSDIDLDHVSLDKNLTIKNRDGNDDILFKEIGVGGTLKITNGDGGSTTDIQMNSVVNKNLLIKNTGGNDSVFLTDSAVHGKVKIQNGEGPGRFHLQAGSTIDKGFDYKGGSDDDNVQFGDGTITGKIKVDNRDGDNETTADIHFVATGNLMVRSGNDNDEIYFSGPILQGRVRLDLRGGTQDWIDIDFDALLEDDLSISSKADNVRVFLDGSVDVLGDVSLKSGASNITTLDLVGSFGSLRADAKGPLEVGSVNAVIMGDARFKAGGNDPSDLRIDGTSIQGDLSWSSRDGDDRLDVRGGSTLGGRFTAAVGGGTNAVNIANADIAGAVTVKGKNGGDDFQVQQDSTIGGSIGVDFAQGHCTTIISPGPGIRAFGGGIRLKCKERVGEGCGQLLRNIDSAGKVQLSSGAGDASIEIADVEFPGLEIDTGPGDDFVTIQTKNNLPTSTVGPTRIRLGHGSDTLDVGHDTGSVVFQGGALFDGGADGDTLDHMGHGNVYPPGEPTIKNFETEN
jgi:hypothetical protein